MSGFFEHFRAIAVYLVSQQNSRVICAIVVRSLALQECLRPRSRARIPARGARAMQLRLAAAIGGAQGYCRGSRAILGFLEGL